jgi:hypothetical protein
MTVNANDLDAMWGRRWEIIFTPANGSPSIILTSSDFGNYSLRATFHIERPGYQAIAYAEVSIWNLNDDTINAIIPPTQGFSPTVGTITIQGGYIKGNFGIIYTGQVFQTRIKYDNVVDRILILNCIDGLKELMNNYAAITFSAGVNHQTIVNGIANQAEQPLSVGSLSDSLSNVQLPRGKVVFGEPKKFLREIAQSNNGQFYVVDGKTNITSFYDAPQGQSLVISPPPNGGLAGYPDQVDGGVKFKVLLNPALKLTYPPMSITLNTVKINQAQVQYGSKQLPYILSPSGQYKVVRVIHSGDTRGNDWYSEITAATPQGMLPYLVTQTLT